MNVSLKREWSVAIFLMRCAIDISMLSLTRYASGWKIAYLYLIVSKQAWAVGV